MGLIEKLPYILSQSREACRLAEAVHFSIDSVVGDTDENDAEFSNIFASGDNMAFMRSLYDSGAAGKIKLIYMDPPFFSSTNYGSDIKISDDKIGYLPKIKQLAYHDSWKGGMEDYLTMLCTRFYMMKDLLSDDGSIFVHLDWHVVHYVKILLDEIFGEKNFVNEIIWNYKSGGSSTRHYSRKHDTILFYSKSRNYYFRPQKEKSYNRKYRPYRFKGVKEYRDENGWYTMVNMKDVWHVNMVGRTAAERTGYATQKPEALISRILESSTEPGDIVADFFGGSGTLAAAAGKMGRKWIYCDLGDLAVTSAEKRLIGNGESFVSVKEDGKDIHRCMIDAEISEKPSSTDDGVLTIMLTDYRILDGSSVPVEEKYRKMIDDAARKDPLRFIDFWSVDLTYDGNVHRTDKLVLRKKEYMPVSVDVLSRDVKCVSIKAHDIFGNTAHKIIDIRADCFREDHDN